MFVIFVFCFLYFSVFVVEAGCDIGGGGTSWVFVIFVFCLYFSVFILEVGCDIGGGGTSWVFVRAAG